LSDVTELTPEILASAESHRSAAARKVLAIYQAVTVLMLLGIAGLALYAYKLGPLVGTGAESSFGFAVAAMFLMGALLAHIADVTYRVWPLGRRFRPATPPPATPRAAASFLTWLVVLAVALGIAYVVAQLLM
jgi:hypothetical protein